MKEKTQIEKIIDAIEFKERVKKEEITVIKKNRKEEWNAELEDSPYNPYYGLDLKCALALMKGIKKGLNTKDAVYVSEHVFKIPVQRTRDLLYKYSTVGETFYRESFDIQKKGFCKRLLKEKRDN